jgi:hypothetical protein
MSGYAGRHRDALTGALVAAAGDRSRRRVIVLAAVAVAAVVAALFAVSMVTQVNGEGPTASPTVPPEAGLHLLGRQGDLGDLAEQRQAVGQGVTTTTPDGQPTDSATTSEASSATDEASPEALAASASRTAGSTANTPGVAGVSPKASSTSTAAASATEPNPRSVAKGMFSAFGFADSEFGCLNAMWNRLDKWGSVADVRPGLAYIKSRDATPCAGWDHVRATGQY